MRVPTTWVLGLVLLATSQRASALNVTRGPYLQLLTTHSVTVLWQTNGPGRCGVALRAADGSIAEIDGATGGVCVVPLDGLDQGTAYAYTPLADGVPVGPESVFRTDDPLAPLAFFVVGDTGSGNANQSAVRDLMLAAPADFFLHAGDVMYDFGFDKEFFVPYRDVLPQLAFWPVVGNHDVSTAGGVPWSGFFLTPANNPARVPHYYSFDAGNAHFAVIDSNQSTAPGSPQYVFLDHDLAASTALWKFVALHHSIYSSGYVHGSNLPIRAHLVPLLDARGVDMVFMGHEHNYERTFPLRGNQVVSPGQGTVYVTSGGGGHDLYALKPKSGFTAYYESTFGLTRVAINRGTLALQMIRSDGVVRDGVTLTKPLPPGCGDGVVNQPQEQCDGADHGSCPGGCTADCTCAPFCGDGRVDQLSEQCDGADAAACPGACGTDCRCPLRPRCGDGVVNQPAEQCDGGDDAACPGRCLLNCGCADPPVTVDLAPVADTTLVASTQSTWDHGAATHLDVGLKPLPALAYLKFDLSGVRRRVLKATLTLTCTQASPDGGTVYPGRDSSWIEGTRTGVDKTSATGTGLKWKDVDSNYDGKIDARDTARAAPDFTRPLASLGAVLQGRSYSVDVTAGVASGPSVYTLALTGLKPALASYASRENRTANGPGNGPVLHLVVAAPARCGDGLVNQAGEQCDGTANTACPGRCRVDCTCAPPPSCGDNLVDQPGEECDGLASAACPGRCRRDCTCVPLPRCGDGAVNQVAEQCDGADSAACPGGCLADCTCAPPAAVVDADASVNAAKPSGNYGKKTLLEVDATPFNCAYLRIRVTGLRPRRAASAHLLLQVAKKSKATSNSGGRLRAVTNCNWNELALTWKTQPPIDGPIVAQAAGPVRANQIVDFDVTSAIGGDGVYCFALDPASTNNVQ